VSFRTSCRKVLNQTFCMMTVAAIALGISSCGDTTGVQLPTAPLGLNVTPWDYVYAADTSAGGGVNVIQPLLKSVNIGQLRFGGGAYADFYDWRSNTSIANCLPNDATASFTSSCASKDPLSFSQFSRQAKAIGAESFVTVNFGSGTPAQAAAWVATAARTPGESVALWEVGNESYGCWEVDNELARPPSNYRGYKPSANGANNATCPLNSEGDADGMHTLATSYAANAQRFMRAMKAADPSVQIGVPWAFGTSVKGAGIADSNEWNDIVLTADAKFVSFVDAHYYPFNFLGSLGGHNPNAQQILAALRRIPALYQGIRATLNIYAPTASVVIGETAVSNSETSTSCTPIGALFAAGDVLSWLAAGAQSVDWWNMNNYGNKTSTCVNPDYGLFTSSDPPTVETPYYGYLLASKLAQPHALLSTLATSDPGDILAFQSALPDGKGAIAFINTNTESGRKITFHASTALSSTLRIWNYGLHTPKVITDTIPAASISTGIRVPAGSMIVLATQ